MASSDGDVGARRAKVVVFSLKSRRLGKMTILRTTGEVTYKKFYQVIGLEMETNRNYDYEGRSGIDSTELN